ncbi:MAG: methyltransferase domain-containing protein [candidate division WOR-3 bacterium]
MERKRYLNNLFRFVKKGKIIELGCGSGFVLQELAKRFKDSLIVGVDKDSKRLLEAAKLGLRNVLLINSDILKLNLLENQFDTVLLIAVFHEIYSFNKNKGLEKLFLIVNKILKKKGVFLIEDYVIPEKTIVELELKNANAYNKFSLFIDEYEKRKIRYQKVNDLIRLNLKDALEFLTKYFSIGTNRWDFEKKEIHYFLDFNAYQKLINKFGFKIKYHKIWQRDFRDIEEIKKDIKPNFDLKDYFIQLVLEKIDN